jgi:S-sulfo-L-cysteine synthase (3-phospho-L-serine-dependent)
MTPPPFRVETGHDVPADLPDEVAKALIAEVHRALDAFGMVVGASHAEVKLTDDGPCVVEIGGRLGGDFIPQLVRLATGVDLHLEELRAVLGGAAPTEYVVPRRAAAMRVLHAPPGGVLRWPDADVLAGTALGRTLAGLHHWYPDYSPVPVVDSSARRLGACLLAGEPGEVAAACDELDLLGPQILPAAS